LEGYRIFCSTLVEIAATVAPVKVPGPGRGGGPGSYADPSSLVE